MSVRRLWLWRRRGGLALRPQNYPLSSAPSSTRRGRWAGLGGRTAESAALKPAWAESPSARTSPPLPAGISGWDGLSCCYPGARDGKPAAQGDRHQLIVRPPRLPALPRLTSPLRPRCGQPFAASPCRRGAKAKPPPRRPKGMAERGFWKRWVLTSAIPVQCKPIGTALAQGRGTIDASGAETGGFNQANLVATGRELTTLVALHDHTTT